jgi:cyclopropane-fatty-acyl-phospholipid synthase
MAQAVIDRLPGASTQAIQHHYDVGNEFYRLWLDPLMVYSCALWTGDEDLSAAQINKLDWHLEHAGVKHGHRVLDVGCGWGALLERAVNTFGARSGVGLTLSQAQADAVRDRNPPGVEVRVENWGEHQASQPYDSIVSIGAFEHFARLDQTEAEKLAGYRDFFEFCHRNLRSGGGLSLQTVTYETAHRGRFSPFIENEIFRETDLPHLDEIFRAVRGLFEVRLLRNDGEHYARTLRCWLANLRANKEQVIATAGGQTYATYDKYLAMALVGFHTRAANLARIAMRRLDGRQE